MKKQYSKPDIMYEDFTPSTSIAAGCKHEAEAALYVCGVEYPPFVLFVTGTVEACDTDVEDVPGPFNGICYDNPTPDNNLFTS